MKILKTYFTFFHAVFCSGNNPGFKIRALSPEIGLSLYVADDWIDNKKDIFWFSTVKEEMYIKIVNVQFFLPLPVSTVQMALYFNIFLLCFSGFFQGSQ